MDNPTPKQACAVPVRVVGEQVEFCLVADRRDSRWGFPRGELSTDESPQQAAIRQAAEMAGLNCRLASQQPLDHFGTSRNDRDGAITAFLLLVDDEADLSPDAEARRRWCLPEEARARIRRKPMRRLIDLAIRQIASANGR